MNKSVREGVKKKKTKFPLFTSFPLFFFFHMFFLFHLFPSFFPLFPLFTCVFPLFPTFSPLFPPFSFFPLFSLVFPRAGEPANFLAAPAPAPDFFFKRLQLLIFFPSGSGSCFFFKLLRLQGDKNTRLRLLTIGLSLPKYSFPHKLVR